MPPQPDSRPKQYDAAAAQVDKAEQLQTQRQSLETIIIDTIQEEQALPLPDASMDTSAKAVDQLISPIDAQVIADQVLDITVATDDEKPDAVIALTESEQIASAAQGRLERAEQMSKNVLTGLSHCFQIESPQTKKFRDRIGATTELYDQAHKVRALVEQLNSGDPRFLGENGGRFESFLATELPPYNMMDLSHEKSTRELYLFLEQAALAAAEIYERPESHLPVPTRKQLRELKTQFVENGFPRPVTDARTGKITPLPDIILDRYQQFAVGTPKEVPTDVRDTINFVAKLPDVQDNPSVTLDDLKTVRADHTIDPRKVRSYRMQLAMTRPLIEEKLGIIEPNEALGLNIDQYKLEALNHAQEQADQELHIEKEVTELATGELPGLLEAVAELDPAIESRIKGVEAMQQRLIARFDHLFKVEASAKTLSKESRVLLEGYYPKLTLFDSKTILADKTIAEQQQDLAQIERQLMKHTEAVEAKLETQRAIQLTRLLDNTHTRKFPVQWNIIPVDSLMIRKSKDYSSTQELNQDLATEAARYYTDLFIAIGESEDRFSYKNGESFNLALEADKIRFIKSLPALDQSIQDPYILKGILGSIGEQMQEKDKRPYIYTMQGQSVRFTRQAENITEILKGKLDINPEKGKGKPLTSALGIDRITRTYIETSPLDYRYETETRSPNEIQAEAREQAALAERRGELSQEINIRVERISRNRGPININRLTTNPDAGLIEKLKGSQLDSQSEIPDLEAEAERLSQLEESMEQEKLQYKQDQLATAFAEPNRSNLRSAMGSLFYPNRDYGLALVDSSEVEATPQERIDQMQGSIAQFLYEFSMLDLRVGTAAYTDFIKTGFTPNGRGINHLFSMVIDPALQQQILDKVQALHEEIGTKPKYPQTDTLDTLERGVRQVNSIRSTNMGPPDFLSKDYLRVSSSKDRFDANKVAIYTKLLGENGVSSSFGLRDGARRYLMAQNQYHNHPQRN